MKIVYRKLVSKIMPFLEELYFSRKILRPIGRIQINFLAGGKIMLKERANSKHSYEMLTMIILNSRKFKSILFIFLFYNINFADFVLFRKRWSQAVVDIVTDISKSLDPNSVTSQIVQEFQISSSNNNTTSKPPVSIGTLSANHSVPGTNSASNTAVPYSHWVSDKPKVNNEIYFLFNLHDALVRENQSVLAFDMSGTRFSIFNLDIFNQIVLPKYFPSQFLFHDLLLWSFSNSFLYFQNRYRHFRVSKAAQVIRI